MKVIHIVENLDNSSGGPSQSVPLLVKYLNFLDIENKIFTIQVYENEKNSILDENNIQVCKLPLQGIRKIKYSFKLENKILKELTKDTVIHVHTIWTYPSYVGYKIAKKYNIPLIVSTRGTVYEWALQQSKYIKKIALLLFQKNMLNFADSIHVTEKGEIEALKKIGIENNFVLIPNGIELKEKYDTLDQDILNTIEYQKEKKYIMFLGRIVHNKGLHYLINSFKKLKVKYKNVELLIVGGIEDKDYYSNLERINKVHFLGILDGEKKHTIFSISSLFVLPSRSENFGLSIAEAMTYKIPIITTTGTPWQEIKKNNAGWWIELSQKKLDFAIDEALSCSIDELKEKGNNCFNIIKNYTWIIQAKKMKETYNKILYKGMK